jgi:hypothetical protein
MQGKQKIIKSESLLKNSNDVLLNAVLKLFFKEVEEFKPVQ